MVSRNSLLLSRRAGVLTAMGIGCGVWVHVAYTLLGVGVLMHRSPWLFSAMKFVGAAYLVWLGVNMIRSTPSGRPSNAPAAALSDLGALRTGFLTNALNPKTTIFIVSLFIQVVGSQTPLGVQIGYGVFISVAHMIWFALVALFFSTGAIRDRILRARGWIDRIFGALLIGFGVVIASAGLST